MKILDMINRDQYTSFDVYIVFMAFGLCVPERDTVRTAAPLTDRALQETADAEITSRRRRNYEK